MNVEMRMGTDSWNHNGLSLVPLRVVTPSRGWPDAGPGWSMVRQPLESLRDRSEITADCLFIESGDLAAISVDDLDRLALPLVVAMAAPGAVIADDIADRADGFVFADDDAATMAAVFAGVTGGAPQFRVRDLSDGTARQMNALSAEASRIADALLRLAETQRAAAVTAKPVDSALIRRLLKIRRERDRFFPAEIFADPAWDMLLDLTAAQLEGKHVPVSSLCIAAAVPTTTALRWIRSLAEAGIFHRRMDPADARRSYISLSETASAAMLAYLRVFGDQFAMR